MSRRDAPEPRLTREEAEALLAPYALGALTTREQEQVEQALRDWPEGRRELALLAGSVDALSLVPTQDVVPAPGLEARIIARARSERTSEQTTRRRRRRLGLRPWWRRYATPGLAAALAVVATVFGLLVFQGDDRRGGARPQGQTVLFTEDGSQGVYLTLYRERPFSLTFWGLEPLAEGQTYQLWQLREDEAPEPGPPFQPDANGRAAIALNLTPEDTLVGFAVSLEDADLAPVPSTTLDRITWQIPLD